MSELYVVPMCSFIVKKFKNEISSLKHDQDKAIPVTGREGP
jgi:hypothetical protein